MEDWEKEYGLKTEVIRRISRYTGLNFREVLSLPYSSFLLLNRESWIASYKTSKDGMEVLKTLWRLQQTEADEQAIREFTERKERV